MCPKNFTRNLKSSNNTKVCIELIPNNCSHFTSLPCFCLRRPSMTCRISKSDLHTISLQAMFFFLKPTVPINPLHQQDCVNNLVRSFPLFYLFQSCLVFGFHSLLGRFIVFSADKRIRQALHTCHLFFIVMRILISLTIIQFFHQF